LHKSVRWITISFVLLFLSAALFYKFTGRTILDLTYRKLIFLVVVLAMGPGVLVNSVFKEHWGRARPHHVIEFGGTKEFSPPIVIADQCESNCSFVSGDAAVGFYFFALLFAFGKKYRRLLLPLAICTATTFSSIRVLQGAHFLSDVMFSGVITYFTILVAAHFILNRKDKKTP
jgi:lipid A 4'-phosphatase